MDGAGTLGSGLKSVGYYKMRVRDVQTDNDNDNNSNGNGAYNPDRSHALSGDGYWPNLTQPGG